MPKLLLRDAERFLGEVPEEYVFRCADGNILCNIRELRDALLSMGDATFTYHSNHDKKDFSNWVRDVIGDSRLATDLAEATSRQQAAKRTADRVALLSEKLATKNISGDHRSKKREVLGR